MIWGEIGENPKYEVSDSGSIRNVRTGKILKQQEVNGYKTVALYNGKQKRYLVHRIVGKTFIDNPNCLPEINHINGCKSDNRVENLEWCDKFYNQQHRRNVLKRGNRRVRCVETGSEYDSIKIAAECVGSHIPDIVRACKNGSRAIGYHWEYILE